jgi:hypothetical protein
LWPDVKGTGDKSRTAILVEKTSSSWIIVLTIDAIAVRIKIENFLYFQASLSHSIGYVSSCRSFVKTSNIFSRLLKCLLCRPARAVDHWSSNYFNNQLQLLKMLKVLTKGKLTQPIEWGDGEA